MNCHLAVLILKVAANWQNNLQELIYHRASECMTLNNEYRGGRASLDSEYIPTSYVIFGTSGSHLVAVLASKLLPAGS